MYHIHSCRTNVIVSVWGLLQGKYNNIVRFQVCIYYIYCYRKFIHVHEMIEGFVLLFAVIIFHVKLALRSTPVDG